MSALAAGALWAVLAITSGHTFSALAPISALLLAQILRMNGCAGQWWSVLLAIILTLITWLYAMYLIAAAEMANFLSIPFQEAFLALGPEMASALIRVKLQRLDWTLIFVAMVIAAVYAAQRTTPLIKSNQ